MCRLFLFSLSFTFLWEHFSGRHKAQHHDMAIITPWITKQGICSMEPVQYTQNSKTLVESEI